MLRMTIAPQQAAGHWSGSNHFMISLSGTAAPPRALLTSAASMKANISSVSSGLTGATRVLKNFAISTSNGP